MNKKEIFKKIGGIIAEITEQYQYLSQDTENINELELELFIANSHFLADHLVILQKLNLNTPKILTPAVKILNKPEAEIKALDLPLPIVQALPSDNAIANQVKQEFSNSFEPVFEFENKPIEQLYNRPLTDNEMEVTTEKVVISPSVAVEEVAVKPEIINIPEVKPAYNAPVNENTAEAPKLTINDILSGKSNQKNVASQLNQQQSIKDLKSIISLNDKLLFIKDLFNGYSLAYSEAIDLVNKLDSYEAAENFLNSNYAAKNGWVQKQTSVDQLFELIGRRFAK
jgi:hypothetical protein